MQTVIKNTKSEIEQFLNLIQSGIESWTLAAGIARDCIKEDPEWAEKVHAANPMITTQFVNKFALIGIKYLPQLIVSECPGAKALRKLPLPVQSEYVSKPVPLLIQTQTGWESLNVDLHNLTIDQAAQAFNCDHLRNESEQRAWIEDKREKSAKPAKVEGSYSIDRSHGQVVIHGACTLSKKQLAQLLAQLES